MAGWQAWHRLCTVGRRWGRYWTFAPFPDTCPINNPRLGQTRDRCTRRLFSGEVAGVRGANVGSRETKATAAVGPQCWAMRDVSVTGSRLKSTKLPVSHRSSRLTAKTSSSSCYVIDAHGDGCSGATASYT